MKCKLHINNRLLQCDFLYPSREEYMNVNIFNFSTNFTLGLPKNGVEKSFITSGRSDLFKYSVTRKVLPTSFLFRRNAAIYFSSISVLSPK